MKHDRSVLKKSLMDFFPCVRCCFVPELLFNTWVLIATESISISISNHTRREESFGFAQIRISQHIHALPAIYDALFFRQHLKQSFTIWGMMGNKTPQPRENKSGRLGEKRNPCYAANNESLIARRTSLSFAHESAEHVWETYCTNCRYRFWTWTDTDT